MGRQEELVAVVVVLSVFSTVVVIFSCVLNARSVLSFFSRLVDFVCCKTRKTESRIYTDLNQLLWEVESGGGRLVTSATEEDEQAGGDQPLQVATQDVTILGFFFNVLEEDPKPRQSPNHEETNNTLAEPLL